MSSISISNGNLKLGSIPSVSLPSVITCRTCGCNTKCYARKLERIRKTVANAYRRNLEVLQKDPETYWREVEASIMMSRYFRFHVSGDIPNEEYLIKMVEISKRNSHCEILCFTKRYEFVNGYIASGNEFPENLHIVLSAWEGLEMVNPFKLPEAHVRFKNGYTTAREGAIECSGNCTDCASTDEGCWKLKNGEQVVFNEH